MAAFVYVSNAEDGDIGSYRLEDDGALRALARVPAGKGAMPLAVSPDRRFLYLAVRSKPFSLLSYAIDARSGSLEKISEAPAAESFPYISTDRRGRFLFGASYGADVIAVQPIDATGRIGAALQVIPVARNAHCIRVDATNRYVFVPALGTDRIYQFVFDADSGQLTPNTPPAIQLDAGTGPRHAVFSHDNRFLFVLSELTGTVSTFALDAKSGRLARTHGESILPPNSMLRPGMPRGAAVGGPATNAPPRDASSDIWASDLHLGADGRFLYAAERTGSTLSVLRVDAASGKVVYVASVATEKQPRGFAIDPAGKFLVVSGEKSRTISWYAIFSDGIPRLVGRCESGNGSNWVEMVECG